MRRPSELTSVHPCRTLAALVCWKQKLNTGRMPYAQPCRSSNRSTQQPNPPSLLYYSCPENKKSPSLARPQTRPKARQTSCQPRSALKITRHRIIHSHRGSWCETTSTTLKWRGDTRSRTFCSAMATGKPGKPDTKPAVSLLYSTSGPTALSECGKAFSDGNNCFREDRTADQCWKIFSPWNWNRKTSVGSIR